MHQHPLGKGEREKIHWHPGPDFIVQGEKVLLVHVFFNLFKNALYYLKAANKGEIYIIVEKNAQCQQVIFKDTGKGIKAEFLTSIFEPFFTKTTHGTGLGLAFCKTVLQEMKGNISVESVEGAHTTFILQFPVLS